MHTDLSVQDSGRRILNTPETPMHESLWTCTRRSLCGFSTCPPNPALNHVQNLNVELNSPASPSNGVTWPSAPNDHWITELTISFSDALQNNKVNKLQLLLNIYSQRIRSEPDGLKFDCSKILSSLMHVRQIIISSTPPNPIQTPSFLPTPPPASFTGLGMEIPWWTGKSYNFYTWLSTCSQNFDLTHVSDAAKVQFMVQAMPLEKTPPFHYMGNWPDFKKKLISEFKRDSHLCAWSARSVPTPTYLWICSRGCWGICSQTQEPGVPHCVCERIASHQNSAQHCINPGY